MLDTLGSTLAYREPEKKGKYSKAAYIWGEDKNAKALETDQGRSEREAVLQAALEAKYSGEDAPPWIRKVTPERVEFEHAGKWLGAPYSLKDGKAELGLDHEVELLFTSKRPK